MDTFPEIEDKWNEWYDNKYIHARLEVPGFLSARRFVIFEGAPKYMTLFDLTSIDVLASKTYLKLRDREASLPTDSFEAVTPKLPNFSCGVYEQVYPEREYCMPNTEIIMAVGIDVPPDKEDEFNAWYNTDHIRAMERIPGFVTLRRFAAIQPRSPSLSNLVLPCPKYLALYDIESVEVLQSEAADKARQSPWTSWVHSWYNRRFLNIGRRIYPKPGGEQGEAELKMERDILKKQLRTLPRSRYTVLGDEADADLLPHTAPEPDS